MPREGYSVLAIFVEMADEIISIIKDKRLGYSSKPEFIKEAIRIHLANVRKQQKDYTTKSSK